MTEGEFWSVIEACRGEDFLRAIRDRLAICTPSDLRDFDSLLKEKVDGLATSKHLFALTGEPIAHLTDYAEYVFAGVVGAGRSRYVDVLQDPAAIKAHADDDHLGADLLDLPMLALDEISDEPLDDDFSETRIGIHVALETSPADMPVWRLAVGAYAEWVWGFTPLKRLRADGELRAAQWKRWWQQSGKQVLDINMEIETFMGNDEPGFKIKSGRHRCHVHMIRPRERFAPGAQVEEAERDVAYALERVRSEYRLSPPPPLPPLTLQYSRRGKVSVIVPE